jgi:hypothetical protein
MSNYRIYKAEDLEKLMKDIEEGTVPTRAKPRRATKRKLIVKSIRDN